MTLNTQFAISEYEQSLNDLHSRYAQKHEELKKLLAESKCPPNKLRLTVYGLLNSGKSSILNMLTHSFDPELFRTGDSRVTTALQEFETSDLIYVDTPGIDGGIEDNLVANTGKQQASIVLFVHQATSELEKEEIDLLSQLIKDFGNKAQDSILLTISRCDKVNQEGLNHLQNTIFQQCKKLLKFEPRIIPCSSRRYKKSIETSSPKGKQAFLEQSHFNELLDALERMKELNDPVTSFKNKLIQRRDQLQAEMEQLQGELQSISNSIDQHFKNNLKEFKEHCTELYSFVSTNKEQASNYSKEISEITEKLQEN